MQNLQLDVKGRAKSRQREKSDWGVARRNGRLGGLKVPVCRPEVPNEQSILFYEILFFTDICPISLTIPQVIALWCKHLQPGHRSQSLQV